MDMISNNSTQASRTTGAAPLNGVRVLDFTTFLSGPFCTQILGDLGAEVIKVEPLEGDPCRAIPPHFVGDDSAYFLSTNRNKQSLAVNLKSPEGQRVVERLISRCDVVIENFRPGVCSRLGLDVEEHRRKNPRLIWASISGFGQTGPRRLWPAYDMIVQALSGVMSITGEPGRPSVRLGIPAGDLVAGLYTAIAVNSALFDRERTGEGRIIDVGMLDCQLAMLSYQAQYALVSGQTPGRQGARHDSIPTYRSFIASDGRELVVTANTERMWRDLCSVLELEMLAEDPRFANGASRLTHRDELWPLLEREFARKPASEWIEKLLEKNVPAALIENVTEAMQDARLGERNMVTCVEAPDGRSVEMVGNPIKFADRESESSKFPPRLGEDSSTVLVELLGMRQDEIDELLRTNVIQQASAAREMPSSQQGE